MTRRSETRTPSPSSADCWAGLCNFFFSLQQPLTPPTNSWSVPPPPSTIHHPPSTSGDKACWPSAVQPTQHEKRGIESDLMPSAVVIDAGFGGGTLSLLPLQSTCTPCRLTSLRPLSLSHPWQGRIGIVVGEQPSFSVSSHLNNYVPVHGWVQLKKPRYIGIHSNPPSFCFLGRPANQLISKSCVWDDDGGCTSSAASLFSCCPVNQ